MLAAKRIRGQAGGVTIRLAAIDCRTRRTLSAYWKWGVRLPISEMVQVRKFPGAAIALIIGFVLVTEK
jgi:hypothetical protein